MELARDSIVPASQGVGGRWSLATIALAAIVAIGFFMTVALPYLRLEPAVMARYGAREGWIILHVAAGGVALLTGPVQLWLGISGLAMRVHRRLGVAYVTAVAVGSSAAFYLAAHSALGWGFAAGITGLGIAWVVTTTLAIVAVMRGLIDQHRQWMIRSYTVTFAFVTFRAAWAALQAAGIGTPSEQLAMSSWFCWAVPLLIVEVVMHGRSILGSTAAVDGSRQPITS